VGTRVTPLESYLRRATRGLGASQRALLRAELTGNIEIRALELQLLGLSFEQGVTRALEEMGEASSISNGMAWVYTAPRAARWAVSVALALLCCVAPLNPLTLHVQASSVTDASGRMTGVNLETRSFSTALASAGIPLSRTNLESVDWLEFSESFSTARAWDDRARYELRFPDSGVDLELTSALRALCAMNASVTLEPISSQVRFRVAWQGIATSIALDLEPAEAASFHAGIGRNLETPCQR
jgi:hypothetical protein